MRKAMTTEALAAQTRNDATIAISDNDGSMMKTDHILVAIETHFLQAGRPCGLAPIHLPGIDGHDCKGTNCFTHIEILERIIVGHFTRSSGVQALVRNNTIEAYCFPGGVIQALLREIGTGRPGLSIHVGLGSFADPHSDSGKPSGCTANDLVELTEIDGETRLRYHPFKVDYAILHGIYTDPRGNVNPGEEAIDTDSYPMTLAIHSGGGKIFIQVRDVSEVGMIEPRRVKLPGILIGGIVEHRGQP